MGHFLSFAVKAFFIGNIARAYFLGMFAYLACRRTVETAIGLGAPAATCTPTATRCAG